jgi:hypothetical protein
MGSKTSGQNKAPYYYSLLLNYLSLGHTEQVGISDPQYFMSLTNKERRLRILKPLTT